MQLQQTNVFPADSVGGCLEGVVCSGYRSVGNSCGLNHSSSCLWYVKSADRLCDFFGAAAFSYMLKLFFPHYRDEYRNHRVPADEQDHVWDPGTSRGGHQIPADAAWRDRVCLFEMHRYIQSRCVCCHLKKTTYKLLPEPILQSKSGLFHLETFQVNLFHKPEVFF